MPPSRACGRSRRSSTPTASRRPAAEPSPMHAYEATTDIAAPPDAVWAVVADGGRWPEWAEVRIEGEIAPGAKLKVRADANPQRAFPVEVTEWHPPRRMVWSGGMPLGLFRGVRTFTLEAAVERTRFRLREEYTGPLLPLIWRTMPDLQPSFDAFVAGLRARVEGAPATH